MTWKVSASPASGSLAASVTASGRVLRGGQRLADRHGGVVHRDDRQDDRAGRGARAVAHRVGDGLGAVDVRPTAVKVQAPAPVQASAPLVAGEAAKVTLPPSSAPTRLKLVEPSSLTDRLTVACGGRVVDRRDRHRHRDADPGAVAVVGLDLEGVAAVDVGVRRVGAGAGGGAGQRALGRGHLHRPGEGVAVDVIRDEVDRDRPCPPRWLRLWAGTVGASLIGTTFSVIDRSVHAALAVADLDDGGLDAVGVRGRHERAGPAGGAGQLPVAGGISTVWVRGSPSASADARLKLRVVSSRPTMVASLMTGAVLLTPTRSRSPWRSPWQCRRTRRR